MEKYNYREVMKADIKEFLANNPDVKDNSFDYIYDYLWCEDEITGNGGNWYDNEYKCEEYICHNLDLFFESLFEFGEYEPEICDKIRQYMKDNSLAQWIDCTIRCYLLSECLDDVLKEENNKGNYQYVWI